MTLAAPERVASPDRAVDALVRDHLPLVGYLVREVAARLPAYVNRDDLTSAAMFALVVSARSFDAGRGVPFARFAAIRIRGALTDELRTMDWASRAVRSKARLAESARVELTARFGRTPTRDEIADEMGVPTANLDALDADVQRAALLSLQGISDDGGAEFVPDATVGPEGLILRREQLGYLRDAIAELPERLRTVVEDHFFAQRKMAEIAVKLGVTESRVSQLRSEALAMLRAGLHAQDGDPRGAGAHRQGRRAANQERYATAIATRSTLADRLGATTLLGEAR